MAELEIDKEDDGQKEMEKECCEEEVQPYRKSDYKPIIYITLSVCDCVIDNMIVEMICLKISGI